MKRFEVPCKARVCGLFVLYTIAILLGGTAARLQAQATDAPGQNRRLAARRTPPPELPPTQESVLREKMRAQLKAEGENKFRYAREMHADGYLVRSRQLLQDFLVLFPEHQRRFAALEMLAQIEEQQDHPERAIAAYRRAYASVPGEDRGLEAALRAGRILAGMGRAKEAKALFLEIRARKPDSKLARLIETELQALGLPLVYDRVPSSGHDGIGKNTTENAGEVRQNSTSDTGNARVTGDGGDSDRGLLDGTDRVPTDGGKPFDSGAPSGTSAGENGNSGPDTDARPPEARQSQTDSVSGGRAAAADEALQRMGEGVERPRKP